MLNKIKEIQEKVINGTWDRKNAHLWEGANLIVSDKPIAKNPDAWGSDPHVVVTEFAWEVSALIDALKEACSDWLDYMNKYEFYGRIGDAIETYSKVNHDLQGLLLAVLEEATQCEILFAFRPYFSYGSNMDEGQMAIRCPDAVLLSKGTLPGYRFALDADGVATILLDPSSSVEGLLWMISAADEAKLDQYEGVASGYYRKETVVITLPVRTFASLVYISNRHENRGKRRSGYLDKIIRAAESHNFGQDYIQKIKHYAD